jgi:hypothetical protein
MEPPFEPSPPKGPWRKAYLKAEPLLVGFSLYALTQVASIARGALGYSVDQTAWRWYSLAAGATAFLFSRSHVSTLAFRLIAIRFMNAIGLISKTDYTRIRNVVMKAFTERILKD